MPLSPPPYTTNRFTKSWRLLSSGFRLRSVAIFFLTLVGTGLETLGIGLVVPAIALMTYQNITDKYPELAPVLEGLGNPSQPRLIIYGVIVLLLIYVGKALYLGFLSWKQARYIYDLKADISQRLFERYLRENYEFHLQHNSGQLIRNLTTEATELANRFLYPAVTILTELTVLIGIAALLFYLQPVGAAALFLTTGTAIYGFQYVTRRRLLEWGRRRQQHEGFRIQRAQEGLGGVKDIKLLGREEEFIGQFRQHNTNVALVDHKRLALSHLPRLWLETIGVAGLTVLVIVVLLRDNSTANLVPTIGLFAAATFRVLPSANRLLNALQSVRYASAVIDLIDRELNAGFGKQPTDKGEPIRFEREIEFRDVSYLYPNAAGPSLKDITLHIGKGESIGFVGTSGAGKSTLVDVLLGLLRPTSGHILVDGKDVQDGLRSWQDLFGYVPQAIFLTDDTLRRNVAFGLRDEDIDDEAVRRALDAAQLTDLVATLPAGMNTLVGERGIRLSGGQRQRIGIARALYHNPPVLVFDEATSALDMDTEAGIMESISALKGSRTMVIVAHRLSTVENCDRIYRLEDGRIADDPPLPIPARRV
ncbi:MAG: ABC transporter ATP-binding protein [Alphaproteobacteria bacterium]